MRGLGVGICVNAVSNSQLRTQYRIHLPRLQSSRAVHACLHFDLCGHRDDDDVAISEQITEPSRQ